MRIFDHEKLDVYQISLNFIDLVSDIIKELPKGNCYLSDQLMRASSSITLNIAEGAGEFSKLEKGRFYRMAKRSATECASIIDICHRRKIICETYFIKSKELLVRIVSILIKMAQSCAVV